MGTEKVTLNTQATPVQDQKTSVSTKLTQEQLAKLELPKQLSTKKTEAKNNDVDLKVLNAKLKKDNGTSKSELILLGAAALGAVATALKFVKPSAGKALGLAAKTLANGNKAQKGLKASHAMLAVGGLAGSAALAGCAKEGFLEEEHNHYVPIPTDTVNKPEYHEVIVEKPVYITKTDTVYKTDTIGVPEYITKTDTIYKNDTITVPEYITKTDTIYKKDTITVPEYITKTDTVWKTDTIKVPDYIIDTDTVFKTDTIKVPEYITKTDTIYKKDTITVPEYIEKTDTVFKTDTIKVPEYITKTDTIYETKTDTQYVDKPIYIEVPGETIYVKEDFESEVPEKIKEMAHDLGIDTTGIGKFVYGIDYQDAKNVKVHRSLWDGGSTSRDGKNYVMNDIATGWDDDAETFTFGKNEDFNRHELYLDGEKQLSDCPNTPKAEIHVANGNGTPNWHVFGEKNLGEWLRHEPVTFTKVSPGVWQSSDGFTYEKGDKPNSIRKTNSHGSTWLLKDVSILGGNEAKDPKKTK